MSYLSVARDAIAVTGAAISGIRNFYKRLPDTIIGPSALVLGQSTWTTTPGDRERTTYNFELTLYQAFDKSDDATIAAADDMIDLVQAAYVKGITLGQAETTQCVIRGGSANEWVTIDGAIWLTVVFRLELSSTRQRGYTA